MMANLLVNLVSEQLPFRRLQLTSRVPFRKILFFGANSGMRVASNFLIEYSESAWKVAQVWLFSKFQVHFWRFYNQKPDFRQKTGSCFCENTHRFQTEPKLDLKNSGFEVPMLKRSLVFFLIPNATLPLGLSEHAIGNFWLNWPVFDISNMAVLTCCFDLVNYSKRRPLRQSTI